MRKVGMFLLGIILSFFLISCVVFCEYRYDIEGQLSFESEDYITWVPNPENIS